MSERIVKVMFRGGPVEMVGDKSNPANGVGTEWNPVEQDGWIHLQRVDAHGLVQHMKVPANVCIVHYEPEQPVKAKR